MVTCQARLPIRPPRGAVGASPARKLRRRLRDVTGSSPTVRRFAANEWRVYRALRLHALRDAPDAFGSTLAREEAFPDDEWVQRLAKGADSPMDFPIVAEDDSRPVGLAWVRIDPVDAKVAELYQVWVDPTYRRRGVGRLVIDS